MSSPRRDGTNNRSVDRHPQAVATTLSWADEAADHGDHSEALAWLAVIETVDGTLPLTYKTKRAAWLDAINRNA